jgi:hypothetical protein
VDWCRSSWQLWSTFGGTPPAWIDEPTGREAPHLSPVSPAHLWMTRRAYQQEARDTECSRCGSALHPRPRLDSLDMGPPDFWPLVVSTRCLGWRRHRHVAVVEETPHGLHLQALHPG